ncbi:hypothetical protein PEDI_34300 [Persicobacter diffluens]|uniref:Uncharacterized protein n=1 Tax=Persicobacter diffluens TaxID=981 RepID=A0AAN5ANI1_9BACT|nr:hypothetical protein PEDI_34300 [Persicobacter diffluens]
MKLYSKYSFVPFIIAGISIYFLAWECRGQEAIPFALFIIGTVQISLAGYTRRQYQKSLKNES